MEEILFEKNDRKLNEALKTINKYEKEALNNFNIISERFLGDKIMYENAIQKFEKWKPIRDEIISMTLYHKSDRTFQTARKREARHVAGLAEAMFALNNFAQNKAKSFLADTEKIRSESFRIIYLIVAISFLVIIILMLFLNRSINSPLAKLMDAVHEIRRGNLEKRIKVNSKDEIGELSSAFNEMTEELLESYSGLEEKIRKRTEELKKSQTRFRETFEQVAVGVAHVDIDGAFIRLNRRFCDIIGYTREEMLKKKFSEITHPDDLESALNNYKMALNSDIGTYSLEKRYIKKDKSIVWVNLTVSLVRDFNGAPDYFIGVIEDINDRKKIETESEDLINELEAKNTELERFTYTVSHDLKSPLITIKGFLGALKEDLISNDRELIETDLNYISDAADKMKELLDDLLELSRIGRLVNPSEYIKLNDVIESAIKSISGRILETKVRIEVADDLPLVYGDPIRIREVFENLVDNALKFLGDNPDPHIEIGARSENGGPVIYVKDNGMGIDPKYHDKIFDLFEKLNDNKEGTGVGLATVKRIVELHNGHIWVESDGFGQGSAFCLTIRENI